MHINFSPKSELTDTQSPLALRPGGKYSDIELYCHGYIYPVHRFIICTASDVVATALDGYFKNSKRNFYDINGFSPKAVFLMVHWMYYGQYETALKQWSDTYEDQVAYKDQAFEALAEDHDITGDYKKLGAHLEVNRIASFYNISGLTKSSRKNIEAILESPCNNSLFASILARLDRLVTDKEVYDMFVKRAGKSLREVVATQEFQLVDFSCDFLKDIMKEHLKTESNTNTEDLTFARALKDDSHDAKRNAKQKPKSESESDSFSWSGASSGSDSELRDYLDSFRSDLDSD
ncbi:hypothetical protein KEM56_007226 [Ascosphaera pollenicola]|nr:hypothetical protein KEM56_007226 [Ascosphaera pollenicola]